MNLKNLKLFEYGLPKLNLVIKRFPAALFFCVSTAVLSIYLTEISQTPDTSNSIELILLLFTFFLGIFIFVVAAQICELLEWSLKKKLLVHLAFLSFLLVFAMTNDNERILKTCFSLYVFTSISLLPAIFSVKKKESNKILVSHLLALPKNFATSVAFSAVLCFGLFLAIFSISELFQFKIDEKRYFQIWIFFAVIYAPTLFLSDFPLNQKKTFTHSFEKGSIFIKYILTPLTIIYFLIIYLYFIKIIIIWEMPKQTVSYLTIGFSITGILTHLFSLPLKNTNKLYYFLHKYIYYLILPLLFLLSLAIYMRINEYGITEGRYLLILIAVYILSLSIYNIITEYKNLNIIFISAAILAFLSSFGPWSMFQVSKKSQFNRLFEILKNNKLMSENNLLVSNKDISTNDLREIKSITNYLHKRNFFDSLPDFFTYEEKITRDILYEKLNLNRVSVYGSYLNDTQHFSFYSGRKETILKIEKFQYFISFDKSTAKKISIPINKELSINFRSKSNMFSIQKNNFALLQVPLAQVVENYMNEYKSGVSDNYFYQKLNKEENILEFENENIHLIIIVKNIKGTKNIKSNILEIDEISFDILMSEKIL